MTNTNLPPQAFTREDVAKAYVWVQSQPDYIKNMATSKDALVALYLQARRNGVASLANNQIDSIAPVSSRDFKTQLQSLASELNQFEKPKEILTASAPLNPTPQPLAQIPQTPDFAQSINQSMGQSFNSTFEPSRTFEPEQPRYEERTIEYKVSERRQTNDTLSLDQKSQAIVDKIKSELNLESDSEVVRMLITLGFDKVKAIFPQK